MALKMEKDVSGKMKEMIDICITAGQDDPHAADWLTGTWLEEQMQGQRHLAGLINTFNNFKYKHFALIQIVATIVTGEDMLSWLSGCLTRNYENIRRRKEEYE